MTATYEGTFPSTIVPAFADDVVVNTNELALALRVSRFTILNYKKRGYRFQFGNRTTPGHAKAWLGGVK
jgi:hypothetical protein